MKKLVLSLFLIFFCAVNVNAGPFTYGYGSGTCGAYIKAVEDARENSTCEYSIVKQLYSSWFQGYASGLSHLPGADYVKDMDDNALELWLENYCRAHPLEQFGSACSNLIVELEEK